jgi:hypothetical protein
MSSIQRHNDFVVASLAARYHCETLGHDGHLIAVELGDVEVFVSAQRLQEVVVQRVQDLGV